MRKDTFRYKMTNDSKPSDSPLCGIVRRMEGNVVVDCRGACFCFIV
jgi:hypothetical protein